MHKRYDLLDTIRAYHETGKEPPDPQLKIAGSDRFEKILEEMQWYYKLKDLETGSIFSELFDRLYISKAPIISYDKIAYSIGITTRTLDRYRIQFNDFFIKLNKFESIGRRIQSDRSCQIG